MPSTLSGQVGGSPSRGLVDRPSRPVGDGVVLPAEHADDEVALGVVGLRLSTTCAVHMPRITSPSSTGGT